MMRAIALLPAFLRGGYDDFTSGDWWLYYDALGSYPERSAVLNELYEIASRGHDGVLDLENTKDFLGSEEELEGENDHSNL